MVAKRKKKVRLELMQLLFLFIHYSQVWAPRPSQCHHSKKPSYCVCLLEPFSSFMSPPIINHDNHGGSCTQMVCKTHTRQLVSHEKSSAYYAVANSRQLSTPPSSSSTTSSSAITRELQSHVIIDRKKQEHYG
jgi:hypothetical protein